VPRRPGSLRFAIFKYTVFALLAFNIYLFLVHETLHEAVDSIGWVILLGTFEYETTSLHQDYESAFEKYALYAVQALAYGLVLTATYHYLVLGEWVDLANSVIWLLVCAALAYDVYAPGEYGGVEWRVRNIVKGTLYAALVGLALWWGYEGVTDPEGGLIGLLDFYDAALWIVCFAVIELNVFAHENRDAPAAA
jgi:hypothetical protein